MLLSKGVEESKILLLTLIAAPEGIHRVCEVFPLVKIVTSEIDEGIGEDYQVYPGKNSHQKFLPMFSDPKMLDMAMTESDHRPTRLLLVLIPSTNQFGFCPQLCWAQSVRKVIEAILLNQV